MTGTSSLFSRHNLVVISDDVKFSEVLKNCATRCNEVISFRLGELAIFHKSIASHFSGVICLDIDSYYLSEIYGDFAIKWISNLFPSAIFMIFTSGTDNSGIMGVRYYHKCLEEKALLDCIKQEVRFCKRDGQHFSLTPQEKNVLMALSLGETIKTIAANSQRSIKTIYSQKSYALKKLNVHKTELFSNLLGRFGYHQI
ncbi:helix-turn-helix transcriptional regulator [Buttiauxella gaviniae]|uniref:helix-turn-helix transcriptional regulator n=1 Tax=Buttiauxella gaviniae TaxID=82990 RepID=UPI0007E404DC|nr:LuxR C-terminal-related transcriptional regulator [Buttiauxella gaviniae]